MERLKRPERILINLCRRFPRFGGGGRAKKKQKIIDKLKTFFEKYFGIGGSSKFTELEHKTVTYDLSSQKTLSMVAEPKDSYGK